jgi:hypothetical protein
VLHRGLAVENNSLFEVAELSFPQFVRRLSRRSTKKRDPESELQRRTYAVKRLETWLRATIPDSVLNDMLILSSSFVIVTIY